MPLAQDRSGGVAVEAITAAIRASSGAVSTVMESPSQSTSVPTGPEPTTVPLATTVRSSTTTTLSAPRTVVGAVGDGSPPASALAAPVAPGAPVSSPPATMTWMTPPVMVTSTTTPVLVTTTTTTVVACRNSIDPACGPFRFDPQPGSDNPMTVQVVAGPATVPAGQEVVFTVTLADPDGVSYGSSLFGYGDSGIGDTSMDECKKFGVWDPPARDAAGATKILTIRHTYASPGTYTARFAFEAGPFHCADSVTGRGDRPYASSATGTVTLVVT